MRDLEKIINEVNGSMSIEGMQTITDLWSQCNCYTRWTYFIAETKRQRVLGLPWGMS